MPKALVYTRRPDKTALWLSEAVALAIHAKEGDELTEAQFNSKPVRDLLALRKSQKEDNK